MRAYGLQFSNPAGPLEKRWLLRWRPDGAEHPYIEGKSPEESLDYGDWTHVIDTNAQIVFVAACKIGERFKGLWNTAGGRPKALIVPDSDSTETDLLVGARFWQKVAVELANGATVNQAVEYANGWLDVFEDKHTWMVVGNGNFKVVK